MREPAVQIERGAVLEKDRVGHDGVAPQFR
jgi:hypothetical protein